MGAIYRSRDHGYVLSDDDVLWLARAFVGEFEGHISRKNAQWHFWAWMNRFMLWKGAAGMTHFYELLRAHSQAINPLWMEPGQHKCESSSTGDCDPKKIDRRRRMCALTPEQLVKLKAWQFAQEAQDGTLENPAGEPFYDFAACYRVEKQGRPCSGIDIDGQCFLPYGCLKPGEQAAIKPGDVRVEWGVKRIGYTVVGAVFALAVGWAVYTLTRR